jgi:drug/metabolite transporter (DMT)-like permease
VIWGVPYLLIKVAVEGLSPPVVVFGRTSLAALILVPIAMRRDAIRPALRHWKPLLAFTALEMAGPWLLLTDAERTMPSSLAGLLIAGVPLVAAVASVALGDRTVLEPSRILGLVIGMVGVTFVVGIGAEGAEAWPVIEVVLVVIGYAVAPFIASRALADVPTIGVVATSLAIVAVGYLPAAIWFRPDATPDADSLWALVGLAIICTALAFVVFFALIREVGATRALLFTYVNPAVALVAGVVLLREPLTWFHIAGLVLILAGSVLATGQAPEAAAAATDCGAAEVHLAGEATGPGALSGEEARPRRG